MNASDPSLTPMERVCRADRLAMLRHLKWLSDPVRETHPNLRLEIAWGAPEKGPSCAKTFRLDQIDDAAAFAVWINSSGCNVYTGATLKRADTPAKGRTRSQHAALATCLPIDIDGSFCDGARKLAVIAKPQLLVLTGRAPESRGQLWIRLTSTEDLKLWNEVNRRSVFFSGGDRFALGTYRLMRLAGSVSFPSPQKRARGYDVELTSAHFCPAATYDLQELLDRFPAVVCDRASSLSKKSSDRCDRIASFFERPPLNRTNVALIQSMLDVLPAEYASEYDLWLRTGFALHDFDEGEVGLALWKRFSHRCPEKADGTDFQACWASFSRDYEGDKISLGWLRAQAQAHGWRAPSRWDRSTKIES
jgi:Primase C terminal 2 (PriCT-2)